MNIKLLFFNHICYWILHKFIFDCPQTKCLCYNFQERQRLEQEQALRDMLRNKSEEERDRILAQFQGELDRLMNRQEEQKQTQRDKIIGKLAARKRLKEEMEKEQAVAKELDRITKRHVCNHGYIDFFLFLFSTFLHKADSAYPRWILSVHL